MKKRIIPICSLALAVALIGQSCKKENAMIAAEGGQVRAKKMNETSIYLRPVTSTASSIVTYGDDADAIAFNCATYQLAYAFSQNPDKDIYNWIYQFIENKEWNSEDFRVDAVLVKDLFEKFPEYEVLINNTLANTSLGLPKQFSTYGEIKEVFEKYNDRQPVINIANRGTFDPAKINDGDYAVCAAIQLDDALFGNDLTDQYPGWINGNLFALNEKESINLGKPMFVVSPYKRGPRLPIGTPSPIPGGNGNPWNGSGQEIWIKKIVINTRHESDDKSEVYFSSISCNLDGTVVTPTYGKDWWFHYNSSKSLCDVKKQDIGHDSWIATEKMTPFINDGMDQFIVYNMYERDYIYPIQIFGAVVKASDPNQRWDIYADNVIAGPASAETDYFMFKKDDNTQNNTTTRFDYFSCYNVWVQGDVNISGNNGSMLFSKWH